MTRALLAILLVVGISIPAVADGPGFQDALLDDLVGEWVMTGTIAGNEIVHDVVAEWVLAHQYLRFTDVSREKDADGNLAYEAIVFIGWDDPSGRYVCLWLDVTGGGGLHPKGFGYAEPAEDRLPFVWDTGDGSLLYNTFSYDRTADTWSWLIEVDRGGTWSTFAEVTLARRWADRE